MHQVSHEVCSHEAFHESGGPDTWRRRSFSSLGEMAGVIDDVLERLRLAGYSFSEAFGIRLALEEAIVNAIRHGHREDPSKEVEVSYRVTDAWLLAEVRDQGPGFDPSRVPDPLAAENIEREGGRGVHLIRAYMSWVRYNETGNCVTMCKRRALPIS
jgi:serine/threonine-protein kinase RsbW